MSEERRHHACSPSSLQFVEACPCFRNHDVVHEAAIAGTLQHGVTESGIDDLRLSDDQAAHAAECIDFAERRLRLMQEERSRKVDSLTDVSDSLTDVSLDEADCEIGKVLVLTEEYLAVDNIEREFPGIGSEPTTTGGYVDRVLVSWDRTRAEIIDHKFGAWAVESAENNLQGIAYALGLFRRYPSLRTITVYFKQPAINHLTQHTFTRDKLPELYLRVTTVIERRIAALRSGGFADANPMVPVCLFCARKSECPKLADFALGIARKFHPVEWPESIAPTEIADERNSSLRMRLAALMAVWSEAMKQQTTESVICRGAPLPAGYGLHEGTGRRSVVDAAAFRAVALQHLTEPELAAIASYGLTDAEKLVNDKAPRGSKADSVKSFKQALLDAGAVKPGEKFVYLRAVATAEDARNSGDTTK